MSLSVLEALHGRNVFLTGVTGFVGKVVLEKILRCIPGVQKIFVLIRGNAEKRLRKEIFGAKIFEPFLNSPMLQKVVPIKGDLLEDRCGLSDEDFAAVKQSHVFIHSAATVDFNEKLDEALKKNVLGSLEVLELAKLCPNLLCFVHVSTAYVTSTSRGFKPETLPVLDFDCEEIVQLILQMTPEQLEKNTPSLLGAYPNTYAFTKAIAESILVRRCANVLPLAIVRPTIIGSSTKEPVPGWIDSVSAIAAIVLFSGVGLMRYIYAQPGQILDIVPVDTVVNTILASIPRAILEKRTYIYHVGTSQRNPVRMFEIARWLTAYWNSHNVSRRVDNRPLQWQFYRTKLGFNTTFFLQNRVPAAIYSGFANTMGTPQQRKNAALLKKINKQTLQTTLAFAHFTNNEFIFSVQNTETLNKLLKEDEREVFFFAVDQIDWERYFRYFAYGMQRFVLKEEVKEPTELLKIDVLKEPKLGASENILYQLFPDVAWAYKDYKTNIGIDNLNTLRTSEETQALILKTPRVRAVIEATAAAEKVSVATIEKRAANELRKMAHNLTLPVARVLAWFLRKVFRRMYQGLHVEEKAMEMIREVLPNGPIVLVPTHRSYIDFLIVSYVFFEYDLPLPHIASGEDFLSILFVNWVFRSSGAFFLRRSFKGDELYTALFTEYVHRLVRDWSPIEFFIEGKRSRIGRSLQPKFGLLSMVTDPFFEKSVPDLTVVPVSISYEKVLEAEVYTNELLGEKKTKESLQALLRASRVISLDYGHIHVICNRPISLREFVESSVATDNKLDPFHKEEDRKNIIQELGHKIVYDLNKGIVHTTTALVATILLTYRGGIAHIDLVSKVNWLRNEITAKGAKIAFEGTTEDLVEHAVKLLSHLIVTQRNRYIPNTPPNKGYKNILVLDFYRNQILHLFTAEGIVSCAFSSISSHKEGVVKRQDLIQACKTLSKIFTYEFISKPSSKTEENFDEIIDMMVERNILTQDQDELLHLASDGEGPLTFYCHLFWPLIDSYWVSALSLFSLQPKVTYKRNHLLQRIQWLTEKMHSENKLNFYESCSMEVLVNTLNLFHKWKIIDFKTEKPSRKAKKEKLPESDVVVYLLPPYHQEAPLQEFVEQINYFRQAPVHHSLGMKKRLIANFPVLAKL